jgi:hypothetical protein
MLKLDMALFRCPQRWSSTDELEELWCVEYGLIEEGYMQLVESRGIDPGQDLLQIFAVPFESNFCETGEDRTCQWRRRQRSGFYGRARSWVLKLKGKELEAGQRREAGGHRLGWNVPGTGNIKKVEMDEVSGRQK